MTSHVSCCAVPFVPLWRNRICGVLTRGRGPDVLHLKVQRSSCFEARLDQIVDDFVLPVDRDRAAASQRGHVDAMPGAAEGEIDAVVPQSLAREARAHADLAHQIHRSLLEHTGADALDHVLPGPVLEDDGVDALKMKQLPEHQAGRSGADDADLGAGGHGVSYRFGGRRSAVGGDVILTEERGS